MAIKVAPVEAEVAVENVFSNVSLCSVSTSIPHMPLRYSLVHFMLSYVDCISFHYLL